MLLARGMMSAERRAEILTVAAFLQGQHALAGGGRAVALWVADDADSPEDAAETWRECYSATLVNVGGEPLISVRSVGRATLSRGFGGT